MRKGRAGLTAIGAIVLSLSLALVRPAHAEPADAVADARRHFLEGVQLFERGDFEGARRLFVIADGEHHALPITYNVARADERLGHLQAAVDAYERYLAEGGPGAEYAQAAAVAVAELRSRASRVRVESTPPGARIFVDGAGLAEPSPVTVLLAAGAHHVVAEGNGWRATADFEAAAGKDATVTLVQPQMAEPAPPSPPPPQPPSPSPGDGERVEARGRSGPSGFVAGAAFVVAPTVFFGATNGLTDGTSPAGGQPGIAVEVGYAFTPRAEFLVRGLGTLGSTCSTFGDAHIAGGGPALTYRAADPFWLGVSVLGGNAITCRGALTYDTGLVLAPSIDLAFAIAKTSYGQWLVSASASYFLADAKAHSPLLFFPLGFGLRLF